jgi:NADPH:quinone reductase-like Zn-dependent oxidoreductase
MKMKEISMKAIVATQFGSADVLKLAEVEKPAPKENEILVKILATTVNVGDIRMRSFDVPPLLWLPARLTLGFTRPKNPIYGMELAGIVEAVGKDVTLFEAGDAIFASTLDEKFGAHAEYKCLRQDAAIALKPRNSSFEEAAALAIGGATALHFLRAGGVGPGKNVLIYGASGNVGTYAVQIAKALGAEVTGVCSARNLALVRSLGADRVIDYTSSDYTQTGETYDVIFDTVGKTPFAQARRVLREGGHYLNAVFTGGAPAKLWYEWTTGQHVIGGTAPQRAEALVFLKDLVEAGKLKPVIDRCYPLAQAPDAHRYVETGRKTGNVVLQVAHA